MNDPVEAFPDPIVESELWPGEKPVAKERPWGPLSTLALSVLVFLAYSVVQTALVVVLSRPDHSFSPVPFLPIDGWGMMWATLLSAPFGVGACWGLARLRGPSTRDYLGLRWPSGKTVALCVGLYLVLVAALDSLSYVLDQPVDAGFTQKLYRSGGTLWALWLGLAVGAPLFEETLMRGFLFRGLVDSRLGHAGAVVLTAIVFTLPHMQYNVYGMAHILVVGLVLGTVRDRTGSTWLTMLLHAVQNTAALAEVALSLGTWPG